MSKLVRTPRKAIVLLFACASIAHAADPSKVLRIAMSHGEMGFDPGMASEVNSSAVIAGIMEALLTFAYLARPPRLGLGRLVRAAGGSSPSTNATAALNR